ncbi:MAG: hypothetical protein H7Z16_02815 [Pyrinomonadaceae bacterium]|nr:hypothetical protein [Pyrinomonadaceae bacterium]
MYIVSAYAEMGLLQSRVGSHRIVHSTRVRRDTSKQNHATTRKQLGLSHSALREDPVASTTPSGLPLGDPGPLAAL